jgi:hypothetical protein
MASTTGDATGPRQVGRYELHEQIGTGGMGVVYRARDPQLDRVVAVKLPHFEGPPEQRARGVQRFQREARAIASVAHPNVCAIYDVGEQDCQPFVVMAYLPGPSLGERLKSGGRFEQIDEAVRIAQQILAALGAVHARGIVHRDVKPGNILFDADGKAVLTDFGLARSDDAEALTSEGVALGTPAYMAPEQAAGQLDRVGPCTDLYAVGVVLYQMVTGRLPFEGTPLSVLPRIVHEEPPRPSEFRPDLDPAVEAVILRGLLKEPGERWPDAAAFAAALAGHGAEQPLPPTVGSRPTELLPAVTTTLAPRKRRGAALRLAGWLAGDVLILAPFVFLSVFARTAQDLMFEGLVFLSMLGLLLAFQGVCLWGLVESLYVSEGLLYCAAHGMAGWARRAIARGVPCDVQNELGETPLLLAVTRGDSQTVKTLLECGANPIVPDRFGQTALAVASAQGRGDIVELLRRYAQPARGAQPDSPPGRRRNARRRLLGLALGTGLLAVAIAFLICDRVEITAQQFQQLVKAGQFKNVALLKNVELHRRGGDHAAYVCGDVTNPDSPEIQRLGLRSRRVWAPWPDESDDLYQPRIAWSEAKVVVGDQLPMDIAPGTWSVALMLAWPLVLSLPLLPLIGWRGVFPLLALSAHQPVATPAPRGQEVERPKDVRGAVTAPTWPRKTTWLAVLLVAALFGIPVLVWRAGVHRRAQPGVTAANYAKIKLGMDEKEVSNLLGPGAVLQQQKERYGVYEGDQEYLLKGGKPFGTDPRTAALGKLLRTYSTERKVMVYGSGTTAQITVQFLDDKVIDKRQEGLSSD